MLNQEILEEVNNLFISRYGSDFDINLKCLGALAYFSKDKPEITPIRLKLKEFITQKFGDDNMKLSEMLYLLYNDLDSIPICKVCDNDVKFLTFIRGYKIYCSNKCVGKDPDIIKKKDATAKNNFGEDYRQTVEIKKKKTTMIKYGVDYYSQSNEWREKVKQTSIHRYGVDHYLESDVVINKRVQTNLSKYGVKWGLQSDIVKEKIKETNNIRYGVGNVFQNEDIKEKSRQSMKQKFGEYNISKTKYFQDKFKQTMNDKYNVNNPMQFNEFKERRRQTHHDVYGCDYPFQNPTIMSAMSEKKRVEFYKILFETDRFQNLVEPLFELNDYKGEKLLYEWKCKQCDKIFFGYMTNGTIPRCEVCFPKRRSILQNELFEFCNNFNFKIFSDTRIILDNKKEIDIYIPDLKLGIEFDGLYWHSELAGTTKNYHIDKTLQANSQGIQLIHIFEDEWLYKKDIVKSMISYKLGKIETKIYARKCNIVKVNRVDKNKFLDVNHIQGRVNSKVNYGLMHDDELVALLSMGPPRFNKNYQWEIIRFCNKLNTSVVGGYSKLFKHFVNTCSPKSVITYADLRYGEGKVYETFGFNFINRTKPGYDYVIGDTRESRIKYQKRKLPKLLETFDKSLTEWENMKNNGYNRIWDCGNNVYGWGV